MDLNKQEFEQKSLDGSGYVIGVFEAKDKPNWLGVWINKELGSDRKCVYVDKKKFLDFIKERLKIKGEEVKK